MATNIFLMYVCNNTLKFPESLKQYDKGYPILSFPLIGLNKYPILWIGTTHYEQLQSVIYDKRSCYVKFKNHNRYHKDFMDLFKYIDMVTGTDCSVGIHKLDSSDDPIILERLLMKYLKEYRIYYGDSLICSDPETKKLLDKSVKLEPEVLKKIPKMVFEPGVPIDERRRITRRNYEKTHREKINEKNKRYYEKHKEDIKEKRQAKAALENAAQVVEP